MVNIMDQSSEYQSQMCPGICGDEANVVIINIIRCLAKRNNFVHVVQDRRSVFEIVKRIVCIKRGGTRPEQNETKSTLSLRSVCLTRTSIHERYHRHEVIEFQQNFRTQFDRRRVSLESGSGLSDLDSFSYFV